MSEGPFWLAYTFANGFGQKLESLEFYGSYKLWISLTGHINLDKELLFLWFSDGFQKLHSKFLILTYPIDLIYLEFD
jgi:hypothetical protein